MTRNRKSRKRLIDGKDRKVERWMSRNSADVLSDVVTMLESIKLGGNFEGIAVREL